ncbi:MAG: gliding motility protein GldM [Cyclobacteriaceae bacterium]
MSGGKETPRQKMIGMMYLVLTALLALNVSSTVIDKFVFLNISLEHAVSESDKRNSQTLTGIQKQVNDTGNREKDLVVLKTAQEIRAETRAILTELDTLKKYFVEVTGGEDENGELIGKTDYDRVGHEMMVDGNNYGEPLQARLNGYAAFMAEKVGEEFEPLALDADEDPYWRDQVNQQGKDFAQLYFESTPTPAGMAQISEFQSRITQYETRALDILAGKVGAGDISFDQIKLMVKPESNKVAAGTHYKAELFLTASASGITPTMTKDAEELTVDGNGMGLIDFVATPGNYDANGEARKSFIGTISFTMPGGNDTTFVDTIEYYVVRPVMQIQSASVQALYLNCGNELTVQVPALGTNYNPAFSASGASTIPGAKKGLVTIVPSAAEVTLRVSSNGSPVGNQVFKVRRIPKPEIKAYDRGREIDLKRGIKGAPRTLQLRAVADESFQQFLPKDARFQVAQSEITLVRGGRAVGSVRGNGPDVNLGAIAGQARPGDNIVVEIKKVQRANFRNQVEDFNNYGPKIITIPISG